MNRLFVLVFLITIICISCDTTENITTPDTNPNNNYSNSAIAINVLKWYRGHKAAVSITYDAAWEGNQERITKLSDVVNAVNERDMKIDFECATEKYDDPEEQTYLPMLRNLMNDGVHFFGHGHEHIRFDLVDYDSAFSGMKKCYNLMTEWGLKPKAYGYPGSSFHKQSTRSACKDAGFIGARGATNDRDSIYIMHENLKDDDFLYGLPGIVMGHDDEVYYQDHEEVKPVINMGAVKESWIVFMYHNIGFEGAYAWYSFNDFLKDLDLLKSLDYWAVNMDDAICYIQEYNNLNIEYTLIDSTPELCTYKFVWSDNLDNEIYDHPLSLKINFDGHNSIRNILLDMNTNISIISTDSTTINMDIYPDEKEHLMTIIFD